MRGANRALEQRPPPRPLWRSLLERVDDAPALEIVESGQVLTVEDLDAGFDTRREYEAIPQRRSACEMELLGARQIGIGRQDERQQIPELGKTVPSVGRRESLLVQLARSREKFAGDLL